MNFELIIFLLIAIVLNTTFLWFLALTLRKNHKNAFKEINLYLLELSKELSLNKERMQQIYEQREQIQSLLKTEQNAQHQLRQQFDQHQVNALKVIQDILYKVSSEIQRQVGENLKLHGEILSNKITDLTQETKNILRQISEDVDKQLTAGFEKTTVTFLDVVKRLTIIDEAQKRISELSGSVISLQEILVDKRSRGTFGEVQLSTLLFNMIPENHFSLQHTLSNGKRADCLLFLPPPSGNIAIDSKFPLETFQQLQNSQLSEMERKLLEKKFRQDIRYHIDNIATKYIIEGETSDSAMMFIPAEAIFAEIHSHFPDLVEFAHHSRVWLVSPTTMMAVLTTARAVIKDAATRKQIHIIQEHLIGLGKDFKLFEQRMGKLAQHINQAHKDVEQVHISSKKITSRFIKIEKVDLPTENEFLKIDE